MLSVAQTKTRRRRRDRQRSLLEEQEAISSAIASPQRHVVQSVPSVQEGESIRMEAESVHYTSSNDSRRNSELDDQVNNRTTSPDERLESKFDGASLCPSDLLFGGGYVIEPAEEEENEEQTKERSSSLSPGDFLVSSADFNEARTNGDIEHGDDEVSSSSDRGKPSLTPGDFLFSPDDRTEECYVSCVTSTTTTSTFSQSGVSGGMHSDTHTTSSREDTSNIPHFLPDGNESFPPPDKLGRQRRQRRNLSQDSDVSSPTGQSTYYPASNPSSPVKSPVHAMLPTTSHCTTNIASTFNEPSSRLDGDNISLASTLSTLSSVSASSTATSASDSSATGDANNRSSVGSLSDLDTAGE